MKFKIFIFSFFVFANCYSQKDNKQQIKSEQILEYDSSNGLQNKARVSETGYGKDYLYEYNKDGKIIKESRVELDLKPTLLVKYEYSKSKLLTAAVKYSLSSGKVSSTTTYKYDTQNRLIEEQFTTAENAAGFKNSIGTYEYGANSKDYIFYDKVFDESQKKYILNNTQFCKVDANGNIIHRRFVSPSSQEPYREEKSKYDSKNNKIEDNVADEYSVSTSIYTYNDKNDCIKSVYKSDNNSIETVYEYSYDKFGNWLTKKDNEGHYFERKIEYY